MTVVNSHGAVINPDSLNWPALSADRFPYYIQQSPGPDNPLGKIKFFFPNFHTVYLHDTNMPSMFQEQERALSSGCIRIESPMAMVRLLENETGWTEEMVREQIDSETTRVVLLKKPFPIHLTYFTAFVDANDLYVVNDIYGYDKVILHALLRTGGEVLH